MKWKNFKKIAIETLKPSFHDYGYDLVDFSEFKGSRSLFFCKHLMNNVYTFIEIHMMKWVEPPQDWELDLKPLFTVSILRNEGEVPRIFVPDTEPGHKYFLHVPFANLLIQVLELSVDGISDSLHWEFVTEEDLETQLGNVKDYMIEYGIPWMEDLDNRNPY
jgi:hypothetical protein